MPESSDPYKYPGTDCPSGGRCVWVLSRIRNSNVRRKSRTPRTHRVLVFCFCALATSPANGGSSPPIRVDESLEWTTRNSALIVLGHPLKIDPDIIHDDYSRLEEDVTISVERVLLGDYNANSLTFRCQTDRAWSMKHEVDLTKEKNVTYDRPQLFFLNRSLTGRDQATVIRPRGACEGIS